MMTNTAAAIAAMSSGVPLPTVASDILGSKPTRRIAEDLHIGIKTVEFHRARIREKLSVASPAQLFRLFTPSD